ncbi:superoxide dismutase [Actinoplanes awajinensis]|uniref:Superoxide dismutase n=1 Tax=Actinoplanes awajinensis subsp. mycoplanecinus TaxID=135947 RepID=A0A101J9U3_9ACTN|nr:superoxide dismutase [Actinoplanes awajinensis]KUL22834.1 superoxide dismutase [Actinoplanes awajinensis subsp. mycoplanecinus]
MTTTGPEHNDSAGSGTPETPGPGPVFLGAQQAAGVIAAKHRGDFAGAEQLLKAMGAEHVQARGFCLLAELALSLVRTQTGQSMDEPVQELSLLIAETA